MMNDDTKEEVIKRYPGTFSGAHVANVLKQYLDSINKEDKDKDE